MAAITNRFASSLKTTFDWSGFPLGSVRGGAVFVGLMSFSVRARPVRWSLNGVRTKAEHACRLRPFISVDGGQTSDSSTWIR